MADPGRSGVSACAQAVFPMPQSSKAVRIVPAREPRCASTNRPGTWLVMFLQVRAESARAPDQGVVVALGEAYPERSDNQ